MPDHLPAVDPTEGLKFVDFYEQQYAATVRLAGFLSGDRTMAEDLAQEASLRLQPPFERLDNPVGYMRSAVVNLCHNHRRSTTRETLRLARHGASTRTVSESAAELDATLQRLPFEERAVVVLRHWLGLCEAEIAEHLGCRPGTVKSRHARALKTIRKELS